MKRISLFNILLACVLMLSTFVPASVSAAGSTSKTYSAVVNSDTLNVREKPSVNSKVIGALKNGTKVTVYAKTKSGWSEIRYKNKKAYVSTQFLKFSDSKDQLTEAKLKGQNLQSSVKEIDRLLQEGKIEQVANVNYSKLKKEIESIKPYFEKIKDKSTRDTYINTYLTPALNLVDSLKYDVQQIYLINRVDGMITENKFPEAKSEMDKLKDLQVKSTNHRQEINGGELPESSIQAINKKADLVNQRFTFSYMHQLEWWTTKGQPYTLPKLQKFTNVSGEELKNSYVFNLKRLTAMRTFTNNKYKKLELTISLGEYWNTKQVSEVIGHIIIRKNYYWYPPRFEWSNPSESFDQLDYYGFTKNSTTLKLKYDISDADNIYIAINGVQFGLSDVKFYVKDDAIFPD